MTADCIFCKIAAEEISAKIVYESEDVLAFEDINPEAPVHLLIITKNILKISLSLQITIVNYFIISV